MSSIKLLKNDNIIKEGKVLKEGFVDGLLHYTVKWNDGTEQVTAALSSTKYRYIFSK